MPDIETCNAKSVVTMGRHHEATVTCGLEKDHEEDEHVTAQTTAAKDFTTGKPQQATIIFTWK